MYAIKQRETDGAVIIQDCVNDEVVIKTDEITRFLNELCENEMISEGSEYEKLKENCLLLQAENEELKAELKEPPDEKLVQACHKYYEMKHNRKLSSPVKQTIIDAWIEFYRFIYAEAQK